MRETNSIVLILATARGHRRRRDGLVESRNRQRDAGKGNERINQRLLCVCELSDRLAIAV